MDLKQYLTTHKDKLFTVLVLLTTSLISFGTFDSTIISSDDWSYFVTRYVFDDLHPINLTDRRPFVLVLYYALASLFGLQVKYYYFVNFLILFLSAVLIYIIAKRVFPTYGWLASLIALTYLVYPVDYTRTWIIMIYIRFWWLVSLGVIWLLLDFVESGKKWKYVFAMLGIAIPLGAYEGQFGIILLASALITLLSPNISTKRRLVLFGGTFAIGFSFIIWRIYVQPEFLGIEDSYVGTIQFSPAIIIERYLQGIEIFIKGWFVPIQAQLELIGFNTANWLLLHIIIFGAAFIWLSSKISSTARLLVGQKIPMMKSYFILFLIGGAFWIAGYIPIIALYSPSLHGNASRVNSFAIAGASLMLVSAVAIIATLIARSIPQIRLLSATILLPFIITGVFVQLQVNKERQIAWETQKIIWNGVFGALPDIKDEKSVVIIIPGYEHLRPFQPLPFISSWEIDASAQVLYNNSNIGGHYYYEDLQETELQFTKNGFKPLPTDRVISYKRLIFVYYDPQTQTVELVENLVEKIPLPFSVNNYYPHENISPAKPTTADNRWLVR